MADPHQKTVAGPNRLLVVLAAVAVALTIAIGHRQQISPIAQTSRDHTDFYLRVYDYDRELSAGHWPLNLPDALRGGGHAFPLFYPPLSHGMAVAAYQLTGNVVWAAHLAGLAAVVLAGVMCFGMLNSLTRRVLPSAIGGALYALLPYPYVALDIRGSFAETWAFAFYPVVLLGLVRSLSAERPRAWLPLAVAALLSSHLVMTAWSLPALLLLALFVAWPRLTWVSLFRTGIACVLGAGLTAPFILPALSELNHLRAADPVLMRATPEAVAGVSWAFYESVFRASPYWNLADWCLLGIGSLGLWRTWSDPDPGRRLCWGGLVMYGLFATFARAPVGVWRLVPQALRYVQYPERLLGLASFFFVLTLGLATSWLSGRRSAWLLGTIGLLVALFAWHLGWFVLPRTGETGLTVLDRLQTAYPDRGLTVVGEYLPRGSEPESLARTIQNTKDRVGQSPLLSWQRDPDRFLAEITLPDAGEVPLPLVAYDFYAVKDAGRPVRTGSQAGQLTALLEPGDHTLTITRRWPTSLKVGMLLSVLSWLVLSISLRRSTKPVLR